MRAAFIRFRNFVYVVILIFIAYYYLSGSNEPKCGHESMIDSVYTILEQNDFPQAGISKDNMENIRLSDIITLNKDSAGSYYCQATLTVIYHGRKLTYTIDYNNRIVEKGKGNVLTTVTNIQ